jgi:hypothetical protein
MKKNTHLSKKVVLSFMFISTLTAQKLYAQNAAVAPATHTTTYPKMVGYLSFILPFITVEKGTPASYDFQSNTKIGFPTGVNVLYSSKFGFSYEFTPTIKTVNGHSSMSNLLFDPGPMFRFQYGFTFIPRLAFETSGRFGVTPVFNEVYLRTKAVNYFIAFSLPFRWGTDGGAQTPSSVGLSMQLGFIFN